MLIGWVAVAVIVIAVAYGDFIQSRAAVAHGAWLSRALFEIMGPRQCVAAVAVYALWPPGCGLANLEIYVCIYICISAHTPFTACSHL